MIGFIFSDDGVSIKFSRPYTHEELSNLPKEFITETLPAYSGMTEEELRSRISHKEIFFALNRIQNLNKTPLNRVVNSSCGVFCVKCKSTMSRLNYWNPFSERTCDNKECENSVSRQQKL